MARRHGHELLTAPDEERIATYKQRPGALLHEGRKRRIDGLRAAGPQNKQSAPNTLRGRLHFNCVRTMAADSSD
jgi:hypothetical protein